MDARERYQAWLDHLLIDNDTKAELRALDSDPAEIEDRFFRTLEFGTGGMRGQMGAGSNRMNIYTVRLAVQALAHTLKKTGRTAGGVVIAYDSRHKSREFAEEAAAVLVGNLIPVYVFPAIAPTPLLSYAVRYCQASAGIVITASHNPPAYNGLKVYNERGNQVLAEEADVISSHMAALSLEDVFIDKNPKGSELWRECGEELLDAYYERLLAITPDVEGGHDLRILYTPLHGTGARFVPEILRKASFHAVSTVTEQMVPDGDFSTVRSPNPEARDAYELAFAYTEKDPFDLIIATDPDADRMGVAVLDGDDWVLLNGNQIGVLLLDFILSHLPADKRNKGVVVKTIVTTEMVDAVAEHYGVEVRSTLTGFKYIGELIDLLPEEGRVFIFGFEESYGYLAGDAVRDKDAVLASLLIAKAAAFYKQQGLTLLQRLQALFQTHGYYLQGSCAYEFASSLEAERGAKLISRLQETPIPVIGSEQVVRMLDYSTGKSLDLKTGEEGLIDLPQERVLQWITQGGSKVTLRPSGTEPKMKLYLEVRAGDKRVGETRLAALQQAFDQIVREALATGL